MTTYNVERLCRFVLMGCIVNGCSTKAESGSNGPNNFAQRVDDGTWKLYSGRGVADILARNGDPFTETQSPFSVVTVPDELVTQVMNTPDRVLTMSLEVSAQFDIEIFRRTMDMDAVPTDAKVGATAPTKDVTLRPGDPWLSGYVQVFFPDEDVPKEGVFRDKPLASFTYTQYSKNAWPDGHFSYSADYVERGLREDPKRPTLKYDNLLNTPLNLWPPLPPNWQ